MAESPAKIFREGALDQLSSPERLDTLVRIVGPRHWIPLGTVALLTAAAIAWGVLGRVPITSSARGFLLRPRSIHPIQAPGTGALTSFVPTEGDVVRKGQTIGGIELYEVEKKLEQERQRLAALVGHDASTSEVRKRSEELETEAAKKHRAHLITRSKELRDLWEAQKKVDDSSLAQERAALAERLASARKIVDAAKARTESAAKRSKEAELEAERLEIEAQNRVLDIEHDIQQTRVRERELEQHRRELLDRVRQLQDTVAELDVAQSRRERERLDAAAAFQREKRLIEDATASLELVLARQGSIVSDRDGRIIEVSTTAGQQVQQGARLALIEEDDGARPMVCVAYLPVRDGKRARPGARAQVEPDTVQRERYGGIVAVVKDVSPFPVSLEAVATLTGNLDLARALVGDGARIQVTLELERDATATGLRWSSSRGPDVPITSGTTGNVLIQLEERAPIGFVLPYLER